MNNSKLSKKILILPVLLVLGLFVGYYFAFRDIKNKNENISNLQNELSLLTNKEQNILSMQKNLADLDSDLTSVDNSVIPSDGDVVFIEGLESLARDNGLNIKIESLVFEDNKQMASSSMTILRVKATTSGGWTGTYNFLSELENLPFKIKINNFSFVATSVDDPTGKGKNSKSWQSLFEISVLKYK